MLNCLIAQISGIGGDAPVTEIKLGHGMRWLGIEWIGINAENGRKVLVSIAFIVVISLLTFGLRRLTTLTIGGKRWMRIAFWARQSVNLIGASVLIVGVLSTWFDDPQRLVTAFGLVAAGLGFALQNCAQLCPGNHATREHCRGDSTQHGIESGKCETTARKRSQ